MFGIATMSCRGRCRERRKTERRAVDEGIEGNGGIVVRTRTCPAGTPLTTGSTVRTNLTVIRNHLTIPAGVLRVGADGDERVT